MIYLQNPGLLELATITTMGVSVKDSANPIGRFGTGLKYAIAVLLREGVTLQMWLGTNEYSFYTEPKTIRDKEFQICCMKGPFDYVELPFTTDLGQDWKVWQAYRELRSNCIDEGGAQGEFRPKNEYTTFVVDLPAASLMDVFVQDKGLEKLYENDRVEIYNGSSQVVYYKGIRAKELRIPSKFTYNIKTTLTLTEDRQLAYEYDIDNQISNTVVRMKDEDLLRSIVGASGKWFEHQLRMYTAYEEPSAEYMAVVREKSKKTAKVFRDHLDEITKPEDRLANFLRKLESLCEGYEVNIEKGEHSITLTSGVLN